MTTIHQDNARAFASRPDSYVEQARHSAVREATHFLVDGHPHAALERLLLETNRLYRISDSAVSLDDAWADFVMACNRHGAEIYLEVDGSQA